MPHLILELSSNVSEKGSFSSLFEQCHTLLTACLPTQLAHCKSRATIHDDYWIGDGNIKNGFIHVSLKVLSGRTPETLTQVGEKLMEILKNYFAESMKKLNLQITLEIDELKSLYFKKVVSET